MKDLLASHCGLCAGRCPTAALMGYAKVQEARKFHMRGGRRAPAPTYPRKRLQRYQASRQRQHGTGSARRQRSADGGDFPDGYSCVGENCVPQLQNISGPAATWFRKFVLISDGHTARALDYDLMVAMNFRRPMQRDVRGSPRGRLHDLYDSSWPPRQEPHPRRR